MEGHVWGKGEDREVVGTTQTEEGRGARQGGVGLEPEGVGEEIGSSKVRGDEGGVCLSAADTWERRMVGR